MKKSIIRTVLPILLVLLMLVPCLAACGESGTGDGTTVTTTSGKKNDDTVVTTGNGGPTDPPKRDLGGYKFNAYVRSNQTPNILYYCEDFWVEQAGTDALSMAVYDRNAQIEGDYNCQIIQVDSGENQFTDMQQAYMGNIKYELAILQNQYAVALATNGFLYNLKSNDVVKNMDLKQDYYDQNGISQLSLGGKLYFVSGDMNISTTDAAVVTMFNRTMYGQYPKFESPYDMVEKGTWTVENMINIANQVSVTTNEGAALDATKGDTVGYFEYEYSPLFYYYGSGERISTLDEYGVPQITMNTERSEKVVSMLVDNISVKKNDKIMVGFNDPRWANFTTERVLFTDVRLQEVRTQFHANSSILYGLVPTPKASEDQKDYYSVIYFEAYVHFWTIPKMCTSVDKSSFVIEQMARLSSEEAGGTMEAYFYQTMELAAAQDGQSRKILKMIRESIVYDVALLATSDGTWWGNPFYAYLLELDKATETKFGSTVNQVAIDKADLAIEIAIERFIDPEMPED